jgi:hypothetical protein
VPEPKKMKKQLPHWWWIPAAVVAAGFITFLLYPKDSRTPGGEFTGSPGMKVWIAGDAEKIRPNAPPQPERVSAELHAARNEYASFQLIVCADRMSLKNVNVQLGALTGSSGVKLQDIALFREATIEISSSSFDKPRHEDEGSWPDALIPIGRDRWFGEQRNGCPFDVNTDENQAVWVDIRVPDSARPGDYKGTATVTATGQPTVSVPVSLHVWNFTLPKMASLPTSFGYDSGLLAQHHADTEEEKARLVRMYAREGVANGISPWGLWLNTGLPWYDYDPMHPERGARIPDWSRYDSLYGEVMAGTPDGTANTIDIAPQTVSRSALAAPEVSVGTMGGAGSLAKGTYAYRVTAVNAEGETQGSAHVIVNNTGNQAVSLLWEDVTNAKYPKLNAAKYNVYRSPGPIDTENPMYKGFIGKLRKVYHIAKRGVQPAELWENETYLVATTNGTSWMDVGLKADIKRPCPWMNTTGKREAIAVYREYARRFRAKGWMDRAFLYAYDEPFGKKKLYAGREQAEFFREAVPDGWALVTNTWSPELDGACNLWCVPVNWFDDGEHATADEIKKRQDKGERVWWYHAMMSRGEPLHKGGRWPSYFIDDSAMAARITGFFTWRYNFQGFLYYLTTMAYTKGNNPWRNQFYFDANGDGTLFYPGTPDRVGGSRDIPIPSLRLRFHRQSMQDYEYLKRVADLGDKALADRIAAELVKSPDQFAQDNDHARIDAARITLARRIEELGR